MGMRKWVSLRSSAIITAKDHWEALVARWLRLVCGLCTLKRPLRSPGKLVGYVCPQYGVYLFMTSVAYISWQSEWLHSLPV